MSQHLMLLDKGHLEQVLHVFAYLKQYGQSYLDDSTPDSDETCFIIVDWREHYLTEFQQKRALSNSNPNG